MKKEEIVLFGGGGHCRSVIDVIENEDRFHIAGIVDQAVMLHEKISGYEVIANDDDIPLLAKQYKNFFITIGHIRNSRPRWKLYDKLISSNCQLPVIISPKAHVSGRARLGPGTVVMPFAMVNSGAEIGPNCILNTSCIIEHDTIVGFNNHISTGSIINGNCRIGDNNFIGTNSTILNNITIGDDNLIGAAAVLVKDIGNNHKYFGNPASVIGRTYV